MKYLVTDGKITYTKANPSLVKNEKWADLHMIARKGIVAATTSDVDPYFHDFMDMVNVFEKMSKK